MNKILNSEEGGTKDFKDSFKSILKKYKLAIAALLFIIGVAINITSAQQEGFLWGILGDFGIFLAASVAIPFFYNIFLKAEDRKVFISDLSDVLDSKIDTLITEDREIVINDLSDVLDSKIATLIPGCQEYGLVDFRNKLDFPSLFEKLDKDCELLWLDTYCPSYKDFLNQLEIAIKKGASVRMLVIDPECENAQYRSLEIKGAHYKPPVFSSGVKSFIEELRLCITNENDKLDGSFEIRLYSDLPCIPMYIFRYKKELICGYTSFFLTKPTAYFVHLKWTAKKGGLLEYFHDYFEQKWSDNANHTKFKFPK